MARTQRILVTILHVATVLLWASHAGAQDPATLVAPSHARSEHRHLAALLQEGIARSATFSQLIATLNQTDVVAYLDSNAHMRGGFDGYLLLHVTAAGGIRYVHIMVKPSLPHDRLISIIAHELQHVLEVAEGPIETDAALANRLTPRDIGTCLSACFETVEAEHVQEAVSRELHAHRMR